MNQFTALHVDEPTEPPREWNIQPLEDQFKSRAYPSKTSPVVSTSMERLNIIAIGNSDVKVSPFIFPAGSNSGSIPAPETTPIKSIDDDEMDHLLEFFH